MKHNVMLTVASLLSILFMTFHLTDDPPPIFDSFDQDSDRGWEI